MPIFQDEGVRAKDADEISNTVREHIDEKSIVLSDKASTYNDIEKYYRGTCNRKIHKRGDRYHPEMGTYCNFQCQKEFFRPLSQDQGKIPIALSERICLQAQQEIFRRKAVR